MPDSSKADRPRLSEGDRPLDPRVPDGAAPLAAAPKDRIADLPGAEDPADEVPVPIVMSPAEIDERAQAVEAVRDNRDLEPRTEV